MTQSVFDQVRLSNMTGNRYYYTLKLVDHVIASHNDCVLKVFNVLRL